MAAVKRPTLRISLGHHCPVEDGHLTLMQSSGIYNVNMGVEKSFKGWTGSVPLGERAGEGGGCWASMAPGGGSASLTW